jgi:NADP-dependent 3-hydroxy acid dehydrogenase YdfG
MAGVVICLEGVGPVFSGGRTKGEGKALKAEDVAHAVAAVVTQSAGSFISEVQVRPLRKG